MASVALIYCRFQQSLQRKVMEYEQHDPVIENKKLHEKVRFLQDSKIPLYLISAQYIFHRNLFIEC